MVPVDSAEISDFRRAPEFRGRDIGDTGKYGGHSVVYPDIDRSQLGFDASGRRFHLVGIRNIHRNGQAIATKYAHLTRGDGVRALPCR